MAQRTRRFDACDLDRFVRFGTVLSSWNRVTSVTVLPELTELVGVRHCVICGEREFAEGIVRDVASS